MINTSDNTSATHAILLGATPLGHAHCPQIGLAVGLTPQFWYIHSRRIGHANPHSINSCIMLHVGISCTITSFLMQNVLDTMYSIRACQCRGQYMFSLQLLAHIHKMQPLDSCIQGSSRSTVFNASHSLISDCSASLTVLPAHMREFPLASLLYVYSKQPL